MTREPEASSTAVAPMPTCTHRWGTDTLESRVNFAGRTPQPRALSEVTLFTGFGKHDAITTDPCVREAVAGRISVGPTAGKITATLVPSPEDGVGGGRRGRERMVSAGRCKIKCHRQKAIPPLQFEVAVSPKPSFTSAVLMHSHPFSTTWHATHPLTASHTSLPTTRPSPHISMQQHGSDGGKTTNDSGRVRVG